MLPFPGEHAYRTSMQRLQVLVLVRLVVCRIVSESLHSRRCVSLNLPVCLRTTGCGYMVFGNQSRTYGVDKLDNKLLSAVGKDPPGSTVRLDPVGQERSLHWSGCCIL